MGRRFVQVCAILIVLRSFTNFAKLFQGEDAMMVFFGQILRGGEVALPAVLIGAFMLVTGVAMLMGARWALPMITAYAVFVAINLLAWTVTNPEEFVRVGKQVFSATEDPAARRMGALGFLGYAVIALGTTALPAWVLWKGRAE
jgi:hypothetical protein